MTARSRRFFYRGTGLVELLVSVLLGSFLLALLLQVFVTQRHAWLQVTALASLDARLSFAAEFLSRHVMGAGQQSLPSDVPVSSSALVPIGLSGDHAGADGMPGDTLVLLSEGGQGCIDAMLENNAGVEWRRFAVSDDAGRQELRCEDSEGGPYPVLEGVDAFQVEYGVDTNADLIPDYYADFQHLPESPAVVSLRLGLLVRGDGFVGDGELARTLDWQLLGSDFAGLQSGVDIGDGLLRRMRVVTVALRSVQP